MCALRALSGRLCCGSNSMWDDVMISPFGILIGISWVAVCLFVHGVVGVMYCPVVPESATASREESIHIELKSIILFLLLLTKLI